jgi:phage regulator Rha-like protein
MGFTGKKALQWKIDYISAFNKMEAELQKQHTTLFPFDADLLVQIRGGKTALIQQAQPGEHFMSFESFKEMAERAGYLVVHGDDLKDMTLDGIMRLGVQASRVAEL